MIKSIIVGLLAAGVLFFLATTSRAAESLEDGVADLAQQIVAKSAASERRTLAVSAFPHADDTCSELSNYLVDELVLSLFDFGDGQLQIIERSQLERIFAELELSMSGAVDANTTKELGRLYGVDSLLIGSLTVLGDRLRVISRLIETETGQVFSAAATNVPKTATIVSLMERPSANGCTMRQSGQSSEASTMRDDSTVAGLGQSAQSRPEAAASDELAHTQSIAGLRTTVKSASAGKDGPYVYINISLEVENISDDDIRVALIGPEPQAIDNKGNNYDFWKVSGVSSCESLKNQNIDRCLSLDGQRYSISLNAYTLVPEGSKIVLPYVFYKQTSNEPGQKVTFSSNFAQLFVSSDSDGNQTFKVRSVNFGISDILIDDQE